MREDDDSLYCDNCWDLLQEESISHGWDELQDAAPDNGGAE
jgi:hypothetical protein